MLDALFIGAHPDDVELFAGGLIALLAGKGYHIGILDLTEGERSSRGTPEARREETKRATEILGVESRITLNLGDTLLLETDRNMREIVSALRRLKPGIAFCQYPDDRHPDHVKAAHLAQQAVFYSRLKNYPSDEEPFYIPGYVYYIGNIISPVQPTFIVDITETFERKIEALKAYNTQFFNPGFKDVPTYISSEQFFSFIDVRARYYGGMIGVKYGEAYLLDRPIRSSDPIEFLKDQKFL